MAKNIACDFFLNPFKSETVRLNPHLENILLSDEAYRFHQSLSEYKPTPLVSLSSLARELDIGELWIKDESHRFGLDAFKGLGASFAVHNFLQNHPGSHTFCTATDGNHGKALAWACRIMEQKCIVFLPKHTIPQRIESIQEENASIQVVDGSYDDAIKRAKEWAEKSNAILIQDTSWPDYQEIPALIMQGYLTSFRELEQWLIKEPVDMIMIQAGVGSWAASAAWYFNRISKITLPAIVVVEAYETDCILESIRRNRPTMTSKTRKTLLAGLNCGFPSVVAYGILRQTVDLFMSVSDEYSFNAMKKLYTPSGTDSRITAGESGAAGLGALIALASKDNLLEAKNKIGLNCKSNVLIFNTEGATDSYLFRRIVSDV